MNAAAPKPLTPRQERFWQALLLQLEEQRNFSPMAAAKAAGYSARSASQQGSLLLRHPQIAERLHTYLGSLFRKFDVRIERILHEFSAIAFTRMTDVAAWDPVKGVTVMASEQLSDEARAAVKKVKSKTRRIVTGPEPDDWPIEESEVEIELHDKQKALDRLGEYKRMWARGLFGGEDHGEGATTEDVEEIPFRGVALVAKLPHPDTYGDA